MFYGLLKQDDNSTLWNSNFACGKVWIRGYPLNLYKKIITISRLHEQHRRPLNRSGDRSGSRATLLDLRTRGVGSSDLFGLVFRANLGSSGQALFPAKSPREYRDPNSALRIWPVASKPSKNSQQSSYLEDSVSVIAGARWCRLQMSEESPCYASICEIRQVVYRYTKTEPIPIQPQSLPTPQQRLLMPAKR